LSTSRANRLSGQLRQLALHTQADAARCESHDAIKVGDIAAGEARGMIPSWLASAPLTMPDQMANAGATKRRRIAR
jgi:hypothetical protein